MSLNFKDNQTEKPKAIASQAKANPPLKQPKASKKAMKKKKENSSKKHKPRKNLRKVLLPPLPVYLEAMPFK